MQRKICTKCKKEYPAIAKYFYVDKWHKGGLHCWCKKCFKKKCNEYAKTSKGRITQQKCRNTVNGHLRQVYFDIKRRCANPVKQNTCYKGIKCLFESLNDFRNYVIDVLKTDPRGLKIHRIDNDGHYEKGNIEFLTSDEHRNRHK